MALSDPQIQQLEKEFDIYINKFQSFISSFNTRDEFMATTWMTKLKISNDNIEERKVRNRFAKFFVQKLEAGENIFEDEPFYTLPVEFFSQSIVALKKFVPKDFADSAYTTEEEKKSYIGDLFSSLPDKGSFLARQPVPRDGTFFILILKPGEQPYCFPRK